MSRALCLLLVGAILALPGCSLFVDSRQSVIVTATDTKAELFADGHPIGTGTASVMLTRNQSHTFLAKLPDGRAGTAQVGRSLSFTAVLDIVGGIFFLIPFVGLFAPGAWDLDQTNIVVPVPPPAAPTP